MQPDLVAEAMQGTKNDMARASLPPTRPRTIRSYTFATTEGLDFELLIPTCPSMDPCDGEPQNRNSTRPKPGTCIGWQWTQTHKNSGSAAQC